MAHTLVLYRAGRRADAALRRLAQAADQRGGRVTVLSLALQESESSGCCDRRSVLWNEVCRELASEDIARAALAIDDADEIVLADPRSSGLGSLERRRLRRRSPVPVS